MNRLHTRLGTWTITLCMFFVLSGISAMAKPQASHHRRPSLHYNQQEEKEEGEDRRNRIATDQGSRRGHFGSPPAKKSRRARKPMPQPPIGQR